MMQEVLGGYVFKILGDNKDFKTKVDESTKYTADAIKDLPKADIFKVTEEDKNNVKSLLDQVKEKVQTGLRGLAPREMFKIDEKEEGKIKQAIDKVKQLFSGKDFTSAIKSPLEGVQKQFSQLTDGSTGFSNVWERVVGLFKSGLDLIKSGWAGVIASFKAAGMALRTISLTNPWTALIMAAIAAATYIYSNWNEVKDYFKSLWDTITKYAIAAWTLIKKTAGDAWTWIKDQAEPFIYFSLSLWETIKETAIEVWEGIKETAGEVWDLLKEYVEKFTEASGNKLGNFWDEVKRIFTYIKTIGLETWETIKERLVNVIIGLEFIIRNFKDISTYVWAGIVYQIEKTINQVKYLIVDYIPASLKWFYDNWAEIFLDVYNYTTTVMSNLGTNIVNVFKNLPDLIAGNVQWEKIWKELPSGFQRASKKFIAPERGEGAIEEALRKEYERIRDKVGMDWEQFKLKKWNEFYMRFTEVSKKAFETSPEETGIQWGESFTNGVRKGLEGLDTVAIDSAEALRRMRDYLDRTFPTSDTEGRFVNDFRTRAGMGGKASSPLVNVGGEARPADGGWKQKEEEFQQERKRRIAIRREVFGLPETDIEADVMRRNAGESGVVLGAGDAPIIPRTREELKDIESGARQRRIVFGGAGRPQPDVFLPNVEVGEGNTRIRNDGVERIVKELAEIRRLAEEEKRRKEAGVVEVAEADLEDAE